MMPDPRWLDALKLPDKVIAGLFLFTLLVLGFDYFALVNLADLTALARPIVIIAAALFGCLSFAALGALVYGVVMQRRKRTLLSQRRHMRQQEAEAAQEKYEAQVLARLDFLASEELRYVANALRKNEQSFTAWVHSPHVSNLVAKGMVSSPGGPHHQDHYPFYFVDFVWNHLVRHREQFIAKDDEHKRRKEAEERAKRRR
jgi:hypothetical protein